MNEIKRIIQNQLLASLATLRQCIEHCPKDAWNKTHDDAPFSQVLFHTLFYIDYYFSSDETHFKNQPFHIQHTHIFRDYEELIDKKPEHTYTYDEIMTYFQFCYEKIKNAFDKTNNMDLLGTSSHRNMISLELCIYVIRHIQHHAAQLGLRIQQITGKELQWIRSGYK